MTTSAPVSIRVQNVGKRYRLGTVDSYRTLRDTIANRFGSRKRVEDASSREVWAIKDVSFEVREGEVLGIIGRNGAGKSTLLKLLTRITRPDTGRIEYNGRIAALLEVGTGFHPELTGRENIFMNGSILGMSRADIERRFDEIVAFSGVETFLDTPVKRYSSGMRVRLGFAVAAHLEPDILVVDEVLAVGDAEFQRKCLGRMNEVAADGRTVLFVSHQMEAIQSLCSRALWLSNGKVSGDGPADDIVAEYLSTSLRKGDLIQLADRKDRSGDGVLTVTDVSLGDGSGRSMRTGSPAEIVLTVTGSVSVASLLSIRIAIRDNLERVVTVLANDLSGQTIGIDNFSKRIRCTIDQLPLMPGVYSVDLSLRTKDTLHDKVFNAVNFEILPGDFFGTGKSEHIGFFHAAHRWSIAS